MRGSIPLDCFGGAAYFVVYGGRFGQKPPGMKGVSLLERVQENNVPDIHIPTEDYKTPPIALMSKGIKQALDLISQGKPVYAGCFGGWGRTGTFLAVLAKAWGIPQPIEYVRKEYVQEAVEKREQEVYIEDFPIPFSIKFKVFRMKLRGLFEAGCLTKQYQRGSI